MFLPDKGNSRLFETTLKLFYFSLQQDKVAVGAKPYKEEIEDLKVKLVEVDLEKIKIAKEFEKEYVFALTEHDFNSLSFLSK